MRNLLLLTFIILLPFAASSALGQMQGYNPKHTADPRALEVSLLQLIANPQSYDGKKVRLIGFLQLEFEGDALYLHREDFEHGISANALWVDVPHDMTKDQRKAVNTQYALCEAVFLAGGHGHMGMFSGELASVTRLEAWPFDRPK